jgi:hypothetical protein
VRFTSDVTNGIRPKGALFTGNLKFWFTMEERCEMLTNHFGARYYRDWRDYEGCAKLEG